MKIYSAGIYDSLGKEAISKFFGWVGQQPPVLESYFSQMERGSVDKAIRARPNDLFLDSGAFSAHTQGTDVDLGTYIEFAKAHQGEFTAIAALDVIGDPEQTWINIQKMERAGLSVVPVFHVGSKRKYLLRCLEYPYMALGGLVPHAMRPGVLREWLDGCWRIILHRAPGTRVHGFGMTNCRFMAAYRWASVDSTSWMIGGKIGSIYLPIRNDTDLKIIAVSHKSPPRKHYDEHLCTMPKAYRDSVERKVGELGEDAGITLELLTTDHVARRAWNVRMQLRWLRINKPG